MQLPWPGRVVRGGSWSYDHLNARAAFRSGDASGGRGDDVGLRLVRGIPAS